jgi:hypothetical protein
VFADGGKPFRPPMSAPSTTLPPRPLPWILLGLASGLLLSFAGIGLLKDGVEEKARAQLPFHSPSTPPPTVAPTLAEEPTTPFDNQRAMYAAQLMEAEAEWARQLEAARSESESTRLQALQALDQIHQEELLRERERHAAELAQLRAGAEPLAADSSLLERARSSEVALALGPFLEPGFAQLDNTFSAAPLPFSYAELIATGALEPQSEGWSTLYKIASNRRDRARTRWPAEPSAEDLAGAQRAQELLAELGPALVQIGKLRP